VMTLKPSHRPDPTLLERVVAVPWWAWVGLTVLSHGALRLMVGTDPTGIVQYAVPALFLLTAVVAWRVGRTDHQASPRAAAGIDVASMRWREFETLIARAFELQGFHMNDAGAAGSDAGVDLLMRKERQTYLVHCKTWRAEKVGIETVQGVQAVMKTRGAVGGFILTSGRFSRDATAAAGGFNIRPVDGPALQAMLVLGRAQAARAERAPVVAAEPVPPAPVVALPARAAQAGTPVALSLPCPACGADMKKRLARRGVNAGQYFWSCVRHPECKGTRRVRPE
jgi:restriction system protein